MKKTQKSEAWMERATKVLPGGVNSPVRSFRSVGGKPFVAARADGAIIVDVDGNEYIDLVCSWGALIHGHNHPRIREAVTQALERGTSYGITAPPEVELAERVVNAVPGVEMLRLVNSGTEACLSAIRLARGYTERDLIIKFEGNYHGHADSFLVAAGSGLAQFQVAESAGVTKNVVQNTLSIPYNDIAKLKEAFAKHPQAIAAVILEPVCGNMGVVLPHLEFLRAIRELTKSDGAVMILDEVMTGFRLSYQGSQGVYGIQPDLFCFGKIIGAGFPVAAFGGKAEIMQKLSPLGSVYQAGTLSGNPIGATAGIASLDLLAENQNLIYQTLDSYGSEWKSQLDSQIQMKGYEASVVQMGSMLSLFFCAAPPQNFAEVKASDTAKFRKFFWHLLERGVYFPPSAFESCFLSYAHNEITMEKVVEASLQALDVAFQNG